MRLNKLINILINLKINLIFRDAIKKRENTLKIREIKIK